jgi:hypothetical protein
MAGLAPGVGHRLERQLQAPALKQRQRAEDHHRGGQCQQSRLRGQPPVSRIQAADPGPSRAGGRAQQQGHGQRQHRPCLVGGAQELHRGDAVVDERHAAAQQRPGGIADTHHQQRHERTGQQQGCVAPAPGHDVAAQRQCRHQQRGDDDRRVEQHRGGVIEVRQQPVGVPDAEIGRPVAHQPQALGQARGAPDRADLLGELQEVQAVLGLHEQRRHPPDRRCAGGQDDPPAERDRRARRDLADPHLVEDQQDRADHHQRGHRGVDPTARRCGHQRERRGPPPVARPSQATMDDHHQPGQRGVGEQEDRGPVGEHDHVRIGQEDRAGDQVHDPAAAVQQLVGEPDHAPRRQREQGTQPESLGDPTG